MRVLSLVAAFAIVGYSGLLAIFFTTQRKLLYYPSQTPTTLIEARANPAFSEISVKTRDGIELKGWYAPATTKPYTIVFFHGNADSLHYACQIADPYIANGYGFFLASIEDTAAYQVNPRKLASITTGAPTCRSCCLAVLIADISFFSAIHLEPVWRSKWRLSTALAR